MSYNIYITKHIRGENMEDKELQKQIEQIVGIEIDDDKDKTIEDAVKEILNIKGE